MKRQCTILAATALLLGSQQPTSGQQALLPPKPFGLVSVHFEQNATDGDAEVVFEAKGDQNGLVKLSVVSPDGRTVIDFRAPEASAGIRQFRMESPEPGDIESLKAAYPQGVYRFSGTTSTGVKLQGDSKLSHGLPATVSFVRPSAGAQGVSAEKLVITWTQVRGLVAYIVSIEQEELNSSVVARLPGTATRFTVPDGFMLPGTEYKLAVGTVTENGNASFVETTVKTAATKKIP